MHGEDTNLKALALIQAAIECGRPGKPVNVKI
jgi:hypothetical protein